MPYGNFHSSRANIGGVIKLFLTVIMLFVVIKNIAANELAEHTKAELTIEQLQWVLSVPDHLWSVELEQLASHLENHEFSKADNYIKNWLTHDVEHALLSLMIMNEYFTYFKEHSIATTFAKALEDYSFDERMNILSVLNFDNLAVREVALQVIASSIVQQPKVVEYWLQNTANFNEKQLFHEALTRDELFN